MMKIVYLVSDLRTAGPTNQAYNLISGLAKLECKVFLVTLFNEPVDSWIDRFRIEGITPIQLCSNRKNLIGAAKKLDQIIKREGIQIVHSSGMSADIVNRYLKTSVSKLTTIRQEFNEIGEKYSKIVQFACRLITRMNYKAMDLRVACSHILARNLQNETGFQVESVENGVDIDCFKSIDKELKIKKRIELGLPIDKLLYLSIGIFYQRKQMIELVESFLSLNRKDIALLLVGEGATYEAVLALSKGHDNIIVVGKKTNPLIYYQVSDIFISASLAEGLPNTVMEAMACGLPCILSDIGPHKEILDYATNAGALFITKDYHDLQNIIKQSIDWNLKEKSPSALYIVENFLSKYVMASNYLKLYQKLLPNE